MCNGVAELPVFAETYVHYTPSGCFDWREYGWLVGMRWR